MATNFAFEYRTVTGRAIDLTGLTPKERKLLQQIVRSHRRNPPWHSFSQRWRALARRHDVSPDDPVYWVFQDLESRLGIAQGSLAVPDYRDVIADVIASRFSSRNSFCELTGIDKGQLSRVLAGKSELSLQALRQVLQALDLVLWVRPADDVRAAVSTPCPESEAALSDNI
jgi:transcriptional regulator with XRE-family HTH domain